GIYEENITVNKVALLKQVHSKVVVIRLSWDKFEKTKGQYSYDLIDRQLIYLKDLKLKLIISFSDSPCWASSYNCSNYRPKNYRFYRPIDYNAYARALIRLIDQYGKKIYAYEIWDEPNIAEKWRRPECKISAGICGSTTRKLHNERFIDLIGAEEYSEMILTIFKHLKDRNLQPFLLIGSMKGSDKAYLAKLYKSGILNGTQNVAISMHSFTSVFDIDDFNKENFGKEYGPRYCNEKLPTSRFYCFKQGIELMRNEMIDNNDSNRTLWLTQYGFSSAILKIDEDTDSIEIKGWGGSKNQAYYINDALNIIQKLDYIQVACYYQLNDRTPENRRESKFGLFDNYLKIKPSGQVYSAYFDNLAKNKYNSNNDDKLTSIL
ncbi:unnamed protein product, partial [Didymodactylos carnosus]